VIIGYTRGPMGFGGGQIMKNGAYVAKFTSTGTLIWSKIFGSSTGEALDSGRDVALDAAGNVYITGYFEGTIDFGGPALSDSSPYYWTMFLAKLSGGNGAHIWSRAATNNSRSVVGRAVAINGGAEMLVTGYFDGSADFGSGTITSRGSSDVFAAAYATSNGAPIWSSSYGGTTEDYGWGCAVDTSGAWILTGLFTGSAVFEGQTLTSNGSQDAFLLKLAP
jgi:hypothetical protein